MTPTAWVRYNCPMTDAVNDTLRPADGTPDRPGLLVIISGPSGVGKSTITNKILDRLGAKLSISMTTRPRAARDVDGEHYHFVDPDTFRSAIDRGAFLEWAQVYGNYYGTPRKFVEDHLAAGDVVVLEIDVEGAIQVAKNLPGTYAVFILAPDEEALLDRLRSRKRDDEATIRRRFAQAQAEISRAKASDVYDAFVVNDDFDRAVDAVAELIDRERQRRRNGHPSTV